MRHGALRTERLLAKPITFVHANASDTLASIGFPLMARSGGTSLTSVLFEDRIGDQCPHLCICSLTTPSSSQGAIVMQLVAILI